MKGLLTKDIILLLQRKQSLLLFALISLVMGFSMEGSFIVGYMCLLGAFLAVGTISYDDADNGLLFQMTLPVSRKTYVLSKYVLSGLVLAVCWILSNLLMLGLNAVKGLPLLPEDMAAGAAFLPGILLMVCLMIPVQLKYGPEKSRTVVFLIAGGTAGVILLLTKAFGVDAEAAARILDSVPDAVYIAAGLILCAAALWISVWVSVRIMEKKTF